MKNIPPEPTHIVSFYGRQCYFDEESSAFWARRWWLDWLVPLLCHIHNAVTFLTCSLCPRFEPEGFPLQVVKQLGLLLFICTMLPHPLHAADTVPTQAYQHRALLTREARAVWGLDAPVATFAAQIHQESRWDERAVSRAGAQGLAQFIPTTAKWLPSIAPDTGEPLPFSPSWALRAMVTYDRWLWRRASAVSDCDRWHKTLSAYNGGETRLRREEAMTQAVGMDPGRWGHVALFNAGRSPGNYRENRTYSTRILGRWTDLYRAAGWGTGGCDAQ